MKIDDFRKTGDGISESSEPILNSGERVLGFRELSYSAYRPALFSKTRVLNAREGWVYCTSRRVILIDDGWVEGPDGRRGKKVHEMEFAEIQRVVHKRGRLLIRAESEGREIVFEFRPFGAAARLFDWLRREKEQRILFAKGKSASPYAKE